MGSARGPRSGLLGVALALEVAVGLAGCRSGLSRPGPAQEGPEPAAEPARDAGVSGGNAPALPSRPPRLSRIQDFARERYSGDRAREMVEALDPSYRVPGNRAFDTAIRKVAEVLQASGYVEEEKGGAGVLTYRVERRPLPEPTWEVVGASLRIEGSDDPLMDLASNINLVAANSHSTPEGGIAAEVVYVEGGDEESFQGKDLDGKIVLGEGSVRELFRRAVQEGGALGVLAYRLSDFNRPAVNRDIAPMSSIPYDSAAASWGLLLTGNARDGLLEAMSNGPLRVHVEVETRLYSSEELTLVAEVRGSEAPEERMVLSAHVQESGANDNLSGVAAQAEIARVLAEGVASGAFTPRRTITLLWGDEILSTRRFLEEDPVRARGVLWGLSLDMVGEDTEKTGGTFLIEKMPDPSAVWTRGEDRHTEWGGRPLQPDELTPHYMNDFVLNRCLDQASGSDWVVRTNPFEGGSDHVPFLRAGTAGVLFWHFTDQYYHTDGDRAEMVSPVTLWNVGVCAAVSAVTLTTADEEMAAYLVGEVERGALARLEREGRLSAAALEAGGDPEEERQILESWSRWYRDALATMEDLEVGGASAATRRAIEAARRRVGEAGRRQLERVTGAF